VSKLSTIQIGDRVRSFDFPDNILSREEANPEHSCYAEGVVESVTDPKTHPEFRDCARYAIRVDKRLFGGSTERDQGLVGELVFPPVNGTPSTLGGITNGVELVTPACPECGEVKA
jgi:hypothetical protein